MHRRLVLAAALLLTSGCSGSHTPPPKHSTPHKDSLRELASGPGSQVALTPGASDFAIGAIRYPFLVIAGDGASVERPTARVWVSRSLNAKPFERRTAVLEQVGVAGGTKPDVSHLYVAHLRITRPGKYWVLAKPVGGRAIQGLGNVTVRKASFSPSIGSKAPRSRTPTLDTAHGDPGKLTTSIPPDTALLKYSVAESLRAHKPFVLVFAAPKFCTSRTCGPVVDVVEAVQNRFARRGIRFIHVEIYKNNDPSEGFNRWVREWHLPTEPWVFLVDPQGRVAAKFEGSVSVKELAAAVRRYLT